MIRFNGITIDRKARTISHNGKTHKFMAPRPSGDITFGSVCHLILSSGMSAHELFGLAYEHDPDGGPILGRHIFNVAMQGWTRRFLRRLDLEWRSWKVSGTTLYCIAPISQPLAHKPATRRRRKNFSHMAEAAE